MTTGMQKNHVFQLKNVKRGGSWGGGERKKAEKFPAIRFYSSFKSYFTNLICKFSLKYC